MRSFYRRASVIQCSRPLPSRCSVKPISRISPVSSTSYRIELGETMNSFCPDLQLPWILRLLDTRSLERVTVQVGFAVGIPGPPIVGRHGSDICSYPTLYSTISEADFIFRQCLSVTVRDEMLVSISEEALVGEGTTFVRFLSSPQIEAARQGRPDGFPVFHYRLNFQNEIVDVICSKVPEVVVRHLRKPASPIA